MESMNFHSPMNFYSSMKKLGNIFNFRYKLMNFYSSMRMVFRGLPHGKYF